MLVQDWMSTAPLTVAPDAAVLDALRLLKERGFRRLPIVESGPGGARLLGIVTDKDLKDAMPAAARTGSIWELSSLLARLTVREVMASPVFTARPHETLEAAALRMQEHRVAGLPVVDDDGQLIGMLTISDVLGALTQVLGLREGGVRLTLDMPDVPGSLAQAALAVRPSNIVSVATAGHVNGRRQLVMRVNGDGVSTLQERLRDAGIEVVSALSA